MGRPQYLARILFCELVKGMEMDTTGAGLSTYMGDSGHLVIRITNDTVSFHDGTERKVDEPGKHTWTFETYTGAPPEDLASCFHPDSY